MDLFNEMASPLVQGSDLQLNQQGDLLLVDGEDLTRQQLKRRLLTVSGEYIWFPNYGVGIRQEIGKLKTLEEVRRLEARCTEQVSAINTISSLPPPIVKITSPAVNQLTIEIQYTEKSTNVTKVFKATVSN